MLGEEGFMIVSMFFFYNCNYLLFFLFTLSILFTINMREGDAR